MKLSSNEVEDLVSEFGIQAPHIGRIVGWPLGFLALVLTTAAATFRAMTSAKSEPSRPPAKVWAFAFTTVEHDVLSAVASSSTEEVALIDARHPLALWSPKSYAIARRDIGLFLLGRSCGPLARVVANAGWRAGEVAVAVTERLLHPPALKCSAVVVANQYSPRQKALLRACTVNDVRSVYVQHAAIGGNEGALIVDCAILQGIDSARKYMHQGKPAREMVIGGSVKAEAARELKANGVTENAIGLCPSKIPKRDLKLAATARAFAADRGADTIVVRAHPNDPAFRRWRNYAKQNAFEFSDSRSIPTQEFLARLVGLIAGDSNLVLEAVALGVEVREEPRCRAPSDQYGMIDAGVFCLRRQKAAARRFVHRSRNEDPSLPALVARLATKTVWTSGLQRRHLPSGLDLWFL